jgi:hypothetical protein
MLQTQLLKPSTADLDVLMDRLNPNYKKVEDPVRPSLRSLLWYILEIIEVSIE